MDRRLIARTRFQGLRRLGVAGRHAQDSWLQIDTYLRGALDVAAASLFAEPVPGADGSMHWYASGEGESIALSGLTDDEQTSLLRHLEVVHGEIDRAANDLLKSSDPSKRRLGGMLQAALSFAQSEDGEQSLYRVNGWPVLVNWGTRLDTPDAPSDPLQDFVRRVAKSNPAEPAPAAVVQPYPPVVPPPVPPPVVERIVVEEVAVVRRPVNWLASLIWLLVALLVAILFFMLLRPCGISFLTGDAFCPGMLERRTLELQSEVFALEQQLNDAAPCTSGDEFAKRREEAGGKSGNVSITLIWDDPSDLDLIIACPDGNQINFDKKSACGGLLAVDRNNKASTVVTRPIEQVVFDKAPTAAGFKVIVHKFVDHEPECPDATRCPARWYRTGPIPFQLEISRNGTVETFKGQVGDDQRVTVAEF